jgi:putative FmdB family regulatory protein
MPIYEYECLNCGKHYEVIQKFSEEPLRRCADCGGHLHKLVSQTSFILKGTGWYVTDYASPEKKKAEDTSGKTDTQADKKPDKEKKDKTESTASQKESTTSKS